MWMGKFLASVAEGCDLQCGVGSRTVAQKQDFTNFIDDPRVVLVPHLLGSMQTDRHVCTKVTI